MWLGTCNVDSVQPVEINYVEFKPKNVTKIDVKPAQETICRVNSNSLYRGTSYLPEDLSNNCSDSEKSDEKKMNFLQPRERPSSQLRQRKNVSQSVQQEEKKTRRASTTTPTSGASDSAKEAYDKLFNNGTKQRPAASNRKIRLSYSGSSIAEKSPKESRSRHSVISIGEQEGNVGSNNLKEYRAFNPTPSEQPINQQSDGSSGSRSVSSSTSSVKSMVSSGFNRFSNAIQNTNPYSRHSRYSSSRNDDENPMDIPLVEMAGDPGDHDQRRRRKIGPELV
ncbi:uncharacterized protein [Clytia hemisphaerica]